MVSPTAMMGCIPQYLEYILLPTLNPSVFVQVYDKSPVLVNIWSVQVPEVFVTEVYPVAKKYLNPDE